MSASNLTKLRDRWAIIGTIASKDIVDALRNRLVLSLINLGQVSREDFYKKDSGAVYMTDDGRRKVLTAYQKKKQDEIYHPFIEEKVKIGHLFYIQALLMNRYMRNDLDGYPSFFWR